MPTQTHVRSAPVGVPRRPELRVVETRRNAARLYLFTSVVGNAIFWVLWAALAVSADTWYWWPIVPLIGWTLVLGGHLRHVDGRSRLP